jgi:L-asparagine transporter-like permease
MDRRQAMFETAIRVAVVLSALAVVLTVVLDAVGQVSPARLVTSVTVIGFVWSWIATGRATQEIETAATPSAARRA